ncbi:MAG: M23 family metallopeptidase [Ruminococcaceae bacterium]|nr:M23 family metallopeptidase [Oscillospiraceae bacterium]
MNKKDYLIKTIFFQLLICTLLFIIVFALKMNGNTLFIELDNLLYDKLSNNSVVEEVVDVFSKQKTNDNRKTDEEFTTEQQINNEKIESETVFVPFEEPSLAAEIKGTGGADIQINSKMDIPENVSISLYKLNQKMIKPLSGTITSEFGPRIHPIDGDLRFHAGIDIAADKGTPIYAAFDGAVEEAGYDKWNGYYIKLKHDNNIMTVYCHCEKLNVKNKQVIRAGECVATVGSTGSSTGPHLHFELRINNKSFDPSIALKEANDAV